MRNPSASGEDSTDFVLDLAAGTVQAALAAIPVVGPVVAQLLGVSWGQVKFERMGRFVAELQREFESAQASIDQNFVHRHGFAAMAEEVFDRVGRRENDEKLAAFAAALAHSATTTRPAPRERERYLDLLDDLRPAHLRLLAQLSVRAVPPWPLRSASMPGEEALARKLSEQSGAGLDDIMLDLDDLGRLGLIRPPRETETINVVWADLPSIFTPLGRQFLAFVSPAASQIP